MRRRSQVAFHLSTDAACSAALGAPGRHFLGAVADGGPRIATLMVDGVLCDVRPPHEMQSADLPPPGLLPLAIRCAHLAPSHLWQGGGQADFGWSTFPPLGSVRGSDQMAVAPDYGGRIAVGHVYSRALSTSELVGTFRAQAAVQPTAQVAAQDAA